MTSAVVKDREGSLWIAMSGGGLARWLVTVNAKPGPWQGGLPLGEKRSWHPVYHRLEQCADAHILIAFLA